MVAKVDSDVTMNVADYFRSQSSIGSATVYNLRTGEKTLVPWGSLDWINFGASVLITSAIFGGMGYFFYTVARKAGIL